MDLDYNTRCSGQLFKVLKQFNLIKQSIKDTIKLNIETNKESIKILDIGSALGYNSNIQITSIIDIIRNEMKSNKLIEVYHSDQESNNFSEMFKLINKSKKSYLNRYSNIYSYGKGRSLIYQLLPNESCDIICSFYTFQWVDLDILTSSNEKELFVKSLKDQFIVCKQSIPNYYEFEYLHLNRVMENRYNELRVGGSMVCNILCFEKDDTEHNYKALKDIFRGMANEGLITHDEVDNMYALLLYFGRKETVDRVLNEWDSKGLQVKEKSYIYIDWREENKVSDSSLTIDGNTSNKNSIYFAESVLSFCGPSLRNAIQGSEDRVNHLYDIFKSRFIQLVKQDEKFNVIFSFLFLVITKVK